VCSESDDIAHQVDTPRERALADRAERQYGLLTRAQLLEAGVGAAAIRYRLETGRLHRVHRGVFAIGYRSLSPLATGMAAVLASGPDAVLSHRWAAALWEIGPSWRRPVDVIAPHYRRLPGVSVHRSRTLQRSERTSYRGIPVTIPARTLIDLADLLKDDLALARVVNEALVKRRVRPEELAAMLDRATGRPAITRLRPFLDGTDAPTRSALEDAFLAFVQRHELPRPEVNQRVVRYEVDMLWRRQRLIVELDGRRFHDHPRSFESDRERDANLLAAGYRVVRVTWRRLMQQPEREAARLRALLNQ
jgi:very-short-patch-repair endonuclease